MRLADDPVHAAGVQRFHLDGRERVTGLKGPGVRAAASNAFPASSSLERKGMLL